MPTARQIKEQQIAEAQKIMGFEAAMKVRDDLAAAWAVHGEKWNAFIAQFPKGPMNLTPDHVRAMPEYRQLRDACEKAEAPYKLFATVFNRVFKKEYRAYVYARRAAKLAAVQSAKGE